MDNTVLCVVGPTACGKTKLGVELAKRLDGEVVSVDSMQIYRGMAIGTAAPTPEEMEGIPHHMVAWPTRRRAGPWPGTLGGRRLRGGHPPPGQAPGAGGRHGPVSGRADPGPDFAAGSSGGAIRRSCSSGWSARASAALLAELQPGGPGGRRAAAPGGREAHPPGAGGLYGDGRDHHRPQRGEPAAPPRYDAV